MTKGHTAAPLGSFPNPTGHLVRRARPEPPVAAPCPGGGLVLLGKTELAGDGAGLNLSWGRGPRDQGSSQSLRARPGSCPLGVRQTWWFTRGQGDR